MKISILINHFLIAVVAWIGGSILGGGFGYWAARRMRVLYQDRPNKLKYLVLIPWRSVLGMLILFVWSPLIFIWLGLGTSTGIVVVGLTVSLLACCFVMKIFHELWRPTSLTVRLIAGARSLFIITLFITLGITLVGGGGAGYYLMEQMRLLEYEKLIQATLMLGGLALTADIALGTIQFRHVA